ncbi:MAG TPA: RDD family protein [Pseudoxanthomonas sp.]|jgi:uncharacterized RDD family membrane protein YckC|nr:RDD family protein [Pseudoxanthomonas sp.]
MTQTSTPAPQKPRALVIWRLFGMVYDALPVIAMWLLISAVFTVAYTYLGHHATRENIAPYSPLQILLWLVCWGVTGLYATISWRRGGQTLGMRPWRTRVIDAGGGQPSGRALWLRFAVATLSLLAGGLGFWWAWWDPQRLTWHDRASGTRLIREPKLKR